MTIEHLAQRHIDRIARLDRFLRLAHLGLRGRETAVARKARRRLIGEIEEMIAFERDELADIQTDLAEATEAGVEAIEHYMTGLGNEAWDQFTTVFDKIVLLDAAPIWKRGRRAFDPAMGRSYVVEEGYPKRVPVTAADLGELGALIERIAEDLDITFTVERYFWTEDAFAIWVLSQEHRTDGRSG